MNKIAIKSIIVSIILFSISFSIDTRYSTFGLLDPAKNAPNDDLGNAPSHYQMNATPLPYRQNEYNPDLDGNLGLNDQVAYIRVGHLEEFGFLAGTTPFEVLRRWAYLPEFNSDIDEFSVKNVTLKVLGKIHPVSFVEPIFTNIEETVSCLDNLGDIPLWGGAVFIISPAVSISVKFSLMGGFECIRKTTYKTLVKNSKDYMWLYQNVFNINKSFNSKQKILQSTIDEALSSDIQKITSWLNNHPNQRLPVEIGNEPNIFPYMSPKLYAWYFDEWYNHLKNSLTSDDFSRIDFMNAGIFILDKYPVEILNLLELTNIKYYKASEYFNKFYEYSKNKSSISKLNLHYYPYISQGGVCDKTSLTSSAECTKSILTETIRKSSVNEEVWLTEFGNINPLSEGSTFQFFSKWFEILEEIPQLTKWFFYKSEGTDEKLSNIKFQSGCLAFLMFLTTNFKDYPFDALFKFIDSVFETSFSEDVGSFGEIGMIGLDYSLNSVLQSLIEEGDNGWELNRVGQEYLRRANKTSEELSDWFPSTGSSLITEVKSTFGEQGSNSLALILNEIGQSINGVSTVINIPDGRQLTGIDFNLKMNNNSKWTGLQIFTSCDEQFVNNSDSPMIDLTNSRTGNFESFHSDIGIEGSQITDCPEAEIEFRFYAGHLSEGDLIYLDNVNFRFDDLNPEEPDTTLTVDTTTVTVVQGRQISTNSQQVLLHAGENNFWYSLENVNWNFNTVNFGVQKFNGELMEGFYFNGEQIPSSYYWQGRIECSNCDTVQISITSPHENERLILQASP